MDKMCSFHQSQFNAMSAILIIYLVLIFIQIYAMNQGTVRLMSNQDKTFLKDPVSNLEKYILLRLYNEATY